MRELSDEVINNLIDWKSSNIPHAIIGQRLFKMGVKNKFGKQMSRYSVSNLMRSQGLRTLPDRTKPKVEINKIERRYILRSGIGSFRWISVYSDHSITVGSDQQFSNISIPLEILP